MAILERFINDNYSTDEIAAFSSEMYFLNKKVNSNGYFENRLINSRWRYLLMLGFLTGLIRSKNLRMLD